MDGSESSLVSSTEMRAALSSAFAGSSREFEANQQADALEAMTALLRVLHDAISGGGKTTAVAAKSSGVGGAGAEDSETACQCAVHVSLAVASSHFVLCPGGVAPKKGAGSKVACKGRSGSGGGKSGVRVPTQAPYSEFIKYTNSLVLINKQREWRARTLI